MMLTTYIALKVDPIYRPVAERFREHPDEGGGRTGGAQGGA
jgi:catalase (peroxidase I)